VHLCVKLILTPPLGELMECKCKKIHFTWNKWEIIFEEKLPVGYQYIFSEGARPA